MVLVNTDYITGKELEMLGLAKGSTIQSKNIGRDLTQSFKTIVGGELKSYKEIAQTVYRPRAYRFVGAALANNPFPILIPCHRVIRSDGSFGRFGGGTDLKRKFIELETGYRSWHSGRNQIIR